MKKAKIYYVKAGWRTWSFLRIEFSDGTYGWSEFTVSNSLPIALGKAVYSLCENLSNKSYQNIINEIQRLRLITRQSSGGIVHQAISAIENALWDAKARSLNTSVVNLVGGEVNPIPLYWSHFGTSRVRAYEHIEKQRISCYNDINQLIEDCVKSGVSCVKTNIFIAEPKPIIYMPGFGRENHNVSGIYFNTERRKQAINWLTLLRKRLPESIDLAVDLNFNCTIPDFLSFVKSISDLDLAWIEIDSSIIDNYKSIAGACNYRISTGENFFQIDQFNRCIVNQSAHIFGIDCQWSGLSMALNIAALCNEYGLLISPHNFNSHLSTCISATLSNSIPNLYMLEYDYDDVPWRDELFESVPEVNQGFLTLDQHQIGWGIEPVVSKLDKYSADD
ncbi:hypothetical protein OAE36_00020 [bacterium]|nr:hypothetical protein [bacterium]